MLLLRACRRRYRLAAVCLSVIIHLSTVGAGTHGLPPDPRPRWCSNGPVGAPCSKIDGQKAAWAGIAALAFH